ncbi:MAG: Clp protease [Actinobacteria bacterium]|nr:Clp protease [Actinomycetota bacterium]
MFERFSTEGRAVLLLAQEEAVRFGHNYVGTEHLLLGLAAQGDNGAAQVLGELGLDLPRLKEAVLRMLGPGITAGGSLLAVEDDLALRSLGIDIGLVRAKVEEVFGRGALDPAPPRRRPRRWLRRRCRHTGAGGGHRPFAPRAKKSLELALRESLALGHSWIGPEHLMLGILRVPDCLAATMLRRQGLRIDDLKAAVLARLAGGEEAGP